MVSFDGLQETSAVCDRLISRCCEHQPQGENITATPTADCPENDVEPHLFTLLFLPINKHCPLLQAIAPVGSDWLLVVSNVSS